MVARQLDKEQLRRDANEFAKSLQISPTPDWNKTRKQTRESGRRIMDRSYQRALKKFSSSN